VSIGYGRTDASDGRVFPWCSAHHQLLEPETVKIKFIGMKEADGQAEGQEDREYLSRLGYGKETIPVLDAQAKRYGFEVSHIPVAHPATSSRRNGCRSGRSSPTG